MTDNILSKQNHYSFVLDKGKTHTTMRTRKWTRSFFLDGNATHIWNWNSIGIGIYNIRVDTK